MAARSAASFAFVLLLLALQGPQPARSSQASGSRLLVHRTQRSSPRNALPTLAELDAAAPKQSSVRFSWPRRSKQHQQSRQSVLEGKGNTYCSEDFDEPLSEEPAGLLSLATILPFGADAHFIWAARREVRRLALATALHPTEILQCRQYMESQLSLLVARQQAPPSFARFAPEGTARTLLAHHQN